MKVKFLILGAGPTGLGAAWRLNELGETDWLLIERESEAGGLAGSVLDDKGYTWDRGGHVQFSHYDYFDGLMNTLLAPEEWLHHDRESWVRIRDTFVPYPFQNNLRYLPREVMWDCVRGLIHLLKEPYAGRPRDFGQWAEASFGEGICRHFMRPYNFKVWAYPLEELDCGWVGDRVSVINLERILENILFERDDVSWGPNNRFQFPLRGGTGEVWRRCAARLPADRMRFSTAVDHIDSRKRIAKTAQGEEIGYEALISSLPLDRFVGMTDLGGEKKFVEHAALLRHSSTHIIGLGIRGKPAPEIATKCWMYFPEDNCPFYRATVFSNYSPNNVPDIERGWSLMCEVSESPAKPVEASRVVEESAAGAVRAGLIRQADDVIHTHYRFLSHGYPTPSLERDRGLDFLLPALRERGICSRGRFGAWKYEVSNQDHSLMQGVECVNHLLKGERELTLEEPETVNARRPPAKARA